MKSLTALVFHPIAPGLGVLLILVGFLAPAWAQDEGGKLPPKEKFHLYMLAGQSNMAGRGKVENQDKSSNPRVLMQNQEGKWVPAVDPVHYDKSAAGVGPGRTFGIALAESDKDAVIGLIPTACGGSAIQTWAPGGYHGQTQSHPYDDAITRTRLAMKDGTLKGILWHQGEADCGGTRAEQYKRRLKSLIERFRTEFNDPRLPFIIGQLGQPAQRPWEAGTQLVNDSEEQLAKEMECVGFVSSAGFTFLPDNVHFDGPSQREFGRRFAKVYLDVVGKTPTAGH